MQRCADRSARVATCSWGQNWKRSCQVGHFLLPVVTLAYTVLAYYHRRSELDVTFVKYIEVSDNFIKQQKHFMQCLMQRHLYKNKVQMKNKVINKTILFKYLQSGSIYFSVILINMTVQHYGSNLLLWKHGFESISGTEGVRIHTKNVIVVISESGQSLNSSVVIWACAAAALAVCWCLASPWRCLKSDKIY